MTRSQKCPPSQGTNAQVKRHHAEWENSRQPHARWGSIPTLQNELKKNQTLEKQIFQSINKQLEHTTVKRRKYKQLVNILKKKKTIVVVPMLNLPNIYNNSLLAIALPTSWKRPQKHFKNQRTRESAVR